MQAKPCPICNVKPKLMWQQWFGGTFFYSCEKISHHSTGAYKHSKQALKRWNKIIKTF